MRMRCAASVVAGAEMPHTVVQKAPVRFRFGDYFSRVHGQQFNRWCRAGETFRCRAAMERDPTRQRNFKATVSTGG